MRYYKHNGLSGDQEVRYSSLFGMGGFNLILTSNRSVQMSQEDTDSNAL